MAISLKRPITRLRKTEAIIIAEAIPIFLYKVAGIIYYSSDSYSLNHPIRVGEDLNLLSQKSQKHIILFPVWFSISNNIGDLVRSKENSCDKLIAPAFIEKQKIDTA
jgi:ABC-type microcin C transport system permease subunit YejB